MLQAPRSFAHLSGRVLQRLLSLLKGWPQEFPGAAASRASSASSSACRSSKAGESYLEHLAKGRALLVDETGPSLSFSQRKGLRFLKQLSLSVCQGRFFE